MSEAMMKGYRLSPQQQRLWRLQSATGPRGGTPFWSQAVLRLSGEPERSRLEEAVRRLVQRHELLRTGFAALPGMGQPLQVIAEQGVAPDVSWHDLAGRSQGRAREVLAKVLAEAREQKVEWERGVGLQVAVLGPVGRGRAWWVALSLPAMYGDGRGLSNVGRELGCCYAAGGGVGEGAAAEEVAQYADLSEWQNELFEAEETQAGKAYWAGQEGGGEAVAQWARWSQQYGKTGGSVASEADRVEWRPGRVRVRLSGAERRRLAAAGLVVGVREWVLGCWALLWSRLSSQSRLVIGTHFDGRRYEGLSQAPGLLAKYLPLHVDIQADATMAEVARAVALKCEELRKWQEYYAAEEEREQACAGICYSYAEQGWSEERGGIRWESQREYECIQAYRFKLVCEGEQEGGVRRLWLDYDSARFGAAEVQELAENLRSLLAASGREPERAVSHLALLSERQRRRLIEVVSRGPRVEVGESVGQSVGVHEWFAQQVEQRPDTLAVVCGSEAVSYGELNAGAERLAARLRQQGVGAESLVGLLLERSVAMVVGILGVLKAGGAYVPLEVGHPDERVGYVVADAGLALVVTHESEAERVRRLGAAPVLCGERVESTEEEGEGGEARRGLGVSGQNLCYVIYTSGSTGRPKGVMVTHGQLLNYVSVVRLGLGLSDGMSYGLLTTFAADLGHSVTFPALCTGGCLHVVAAEVGLEAKRLSAYLKEHEIECLKMVPSQLSALMNASRAGERVLPKTHLVLGGEALTEGLVERVMEQAEEKTELVLYNHYGPTETTVGVVAGRVWEAGDSRAGMKAGNAAVGLGRALGNTSVYVVDGSGEVVPQGVAGEVYIGGEGVARGYLQRAELTAERFLPDAFSGEAGARLYRTGDLGRYRLDGELEFLGRLDNQVKIRGYRIELGEIEAALCGLAGVREAVVVARPEAPGEQRLVGYVVMEAGQAGRDEGVRLRRELGARLPDYLLPSAIVELAQLPLTANGKVDRRALPEPERTRQGSESVAARTPVEELLCGIWAAVLGLEGVGVDDNFFELGGHSLLATQVISRVNSAFGVEIPVGSLFDALTVYELAQRVESEIRAGKGVAAPPIVAVSRDRELPLSFAQQRLWFLDQLEPGTSLYNIFKGVRLDGVLDMRALEAALNEITCRHEALRTTFDAIDGRPRQLIAVAKPVALKIEELSEFPDDEREAEVLRLAQEESVRPFDLTQGPLLRVRLLRLNDEEHVMLFTMHHIIGDAWSIALLVRELTTLYRAFHLGTPLALPPLPVQYADYAVWQREWLQNSALDKHVSFWKEQLANAPPVLHLPTDHQRPEVTSLEGARHAAVLNEELAKALEAFSRCKGVTLFMTLVAAFKILLHYLTKCDDVVIGTDVANRNHLETESVFGFFINQLVLRTNLSGDPIIHDLLISVRKTVWAAYAHQELPFDRLVDALNPKRSLKYSPLFQVKFIFQNTGRVGDDEQSLQTESGLRLSGLPVEGITSKFDLTLNANRRPDTLVYWIEYKTSLFNASTIARFAEQFELILSHVVSRPAGKLSEIEEALAESDRQRRARQEKNLKEARLVKFRGLTRKPTAAAPQPGGAAL